MLVSKIGMAQLDFKIENIVVSRVIEEMDENVVDSDFALGPGIRVFLSITNNGDETVVLCRSSFDIEIIFTFDGVRYSKRPFVASFLFVRKRSLAILPNQTFYFDFYDRYLFGADFFMEKTDDPISRRFDHTKEVIATLPTLRVRYWDRNIDITTNEIRNVTVENILYIIG